jgi:diguanylate cyclase (GGDEF)-like protein
VVLAQVASILKRSVRETDLAARYGGEEFTIVLTQTGIADAMVTAERLRIAMADTPVEAPDGTTLRVTVSIGVATFPENAETREGLLQASDRALYAAKGAGRNCAREA